LYSLPIFAFVIALDFFYDRFKKTGRYALIDSMTSLTTGMLGTTIGVIFLGFVGYCYLTAYSVYHMFEFDNSVSTWIISAIIYDFSYYWMHRAHHRINIFWASHAPHHNSEHLNFTTALRQSAFGFLTAGPFFIPMAVIGVPFEQFIFAAGLSTLYGFFTHTGLVKYIPGIEFIFVGPSSHRVHHAKNKYYIDKNYGSILNIWDNIFGTYKREQKKVLVQYGTVTPLNSINPFWVNLKTYQDIATVYLKSNNWKSRFKLFFGPPGAVSGSAITSDLNKNSTIGPENIKIGLPFLIVVFNFFIIAIMTTHLMLFAKHHVNVWIYSYIFMIWVIILINACIADGRQLSNFYVKCMQCFLACWGVFMSFHSVENFELIWFSVLTVVLFCVSLIIKKPQFAMKVY